MNANIEIKDQGLKQLIKAFKNMPSVRVGVLGSKDQRDDNNQNAKIGMIHEFGKGQMPQRSFLRVPITEHLNDYLKKSGLFTAEQLKKVIAEGSIRLWMGNVGKVAEQIVEDAFDSGGFGQWKPSDMHRKDVKMTLVETQQLRKSIGSEVE